MDELSGKTRDGGAYSAAQVAGMVGLTEQQVRGFVRDELVCPSLGADGGPRFSFQDLVLFRTLKSLVDARIPTPRIRKTLRRLKAALPPGKSLSALSLRADATQILVKDAGAEWDPASGQSRFDFSAQRPPSAISPAPETRTAGTPQAWYELGCELEAEDPEKAREAYYRALQLQPDHADTHINLGRLFHEAQKHADAEREYRCALQTRPTDPIAWFNLGIVLEDMGQIRNALLAYTQAITADPGCADAYFNLARLCEKAGQRADAIRHLKAYRNLAPR